MITVDYYESMKTTHWDPIFRALANKLSILLLHATHSRTTYYADGWHLARLVRLTTDQTSIENHMDKTFIGRSQDLPVTPLGSKTPLVQTSPLEIISVNPSQILSGIGDQQNLPVFIPMNFIDTPKIIPYFFYRFSPYEHLSTSNVALSLAQQMNSMLQGTIKLSPELELKLNEACEISTALPAIAPRPNFPATRDGLFLQRRLHSFSSSSNYQPHYSNGRETTNINSMMADLQKGSFNFMNRMRFLEPINPGELKTMHQLPQVSFNRDAPSNLDSQFEFLPVRDEVKTRFRCHSCGRQWTTMKGSITFVVILSHAVSGPVLVDRWTIEPGANVFFELFGQSCGQCNMTCEPKWYPEEIQKVLRNLFVRIHAHFYRDTIPWDDRWDDHRRAGQPTGPHDSRKCIACQSGFCRGINRIAYPESEPLQSTSLTTASQASGSLEPPKSKRRACEGTNAS